MRILTGKHLSRRALLRGAGAALSLPMLESMLPAGKALAQMAVPRVRAGFHLYTARRDNGALDARSRGPRLRAF